MFSPFLSKTVQGLPYQRAIEVSHEAVRSWEQGFDPSYVSEVWQILGARCATSNGAGTWADGSCT